MPKEAIKPEALTIMLSASEAEPGIAIRPAFAMEKPTIPMTTATPREMTHQMEPMRRLKESLLSSLMAMK